MKIKCGEHLGVIHSWMQFEAQNGEYVTWGSDEMLRTSPKSVLEYEHLAQRIANAVFDSVKRKLQVCKKFKLDTTHKKVGYCKICGNHKDFHCKNYGM